MGGRLDDAEKDYNAARDKDPDIPELYINIAALKARRGRPTEAMDNLTLAGAKGFKRWDLIAKDPAFDVLRADPALSSKLNMLRSAGP